MLVDLGVVNGAAIHATDALAKDVHLALVFTSCHRSNFVFLSSTRA